jgi:hypothetical protein
MLLTGYVSIVWLGNVRHAKVCRNDVAAGRLLDKQYLVCFEVCP